MMIDDEDEEDDLERRPTRPRMRAVPPPEPNQGEGDRAADRRYTDHVGDFIASGRVAPAARDAARAVDSDVEGERLREAEEEGKRRARPRLRDRVRGAINRLFRG